MNDLDILKSVFEGKELENAIEKYENGMPAAYIIGEWEFCGDKYFIDESCLIPRCDTERIVESVLAHLPENGMLADLCTGSGCIAISVLKRKKNAIGKAVDISEKALAAAQKNAVLNGVSDRLVFSHADVFTDTLANEKYDVIVSNPPYVTAVDMQKLDEYVQKEPATALFGGEDGMDFYRHIIPSYLKNLKKNGCMIFEIGYDQEEKIKAIANEHDLFCSVTKDYSGNPRVAFITINNSNTEEV